VKDIYHGFRIDTMSEKVRYVLTDNPGLAGWCKYNLDVDADSAVCQYFVSCMVHLQDTEHIL